MQEGHLPLRGTRTLAEHIYPLSFPCYKNRLQSTLLLIHRMTLCYVSMYLHLFPPYFGFVCTRLERCGVQINVHNQVLDFTTNTNSSDGQFEQSTEFATAQWAKDVQQENGQLRAVLEEFQSATDLIMNTHRSQASQRTTHTYIAMYWYTLYILSVFLYFFLRRAQLLWFHFTYVVNTTRPPNSHRSTARSFSLLGWQTSKWMTRLSKLELETDERVFRERQRSDRLEKELVKVNGQLQEMQAVMQLAIDTDIDRSADDSAAVEMARLKAENVGLREMLGIAGMELDPKGAPVLAEEDEGCGTSKAGQPTANGVLNA